MRDRCRGSSPLAVRNRPEVDGLSKGEKGFGVAPLKRLTGSGAPEGRRAPRHTGCGAP